MNDAQYTIAPSDFDGSIEHGNFSFNATDLLLISILKDGVLSPEFAWRDPNNLEYGGCYKVRDYQVRFNRFEESYSIFACARSVGKTERQKIRAFTHYFRWIRQNMLITAPELLHLLPLTDAIESAIESCRLLRECLDTSKAGSTGFGHNPFHANFSDGTRIIGRIPQKDGKGVKGQHQPSLMIEEGQDYPDPGWTEVHATLEKSIPGATYEIYGVHRGGQSGGFYKRAHSGDFKLHTLTAIQRPGWGREEKDQAIAAFGGTAAPDYRRNILGEPGSASSPIFVTARLMDCVDMDRDSEYNTRQYVAQNLNWEECKKSGLGLRELLDFPGNKYQHCIAGLDLGLTNSPTVCSILALMKYKGRNRLALVRRFTLSRFTSPQIRNLIKLIYEWNPAIGGICIDSTGLGFPIFQELQEDENLPSQKILDVVSGFKFNEKIAVETRNHNGLIDEVQMTVIEATTRYLREWVDTGYLLLPFDREVTQDLLAENVKRIENVSRLTGSNKPNAFHILDSLRMATLADRRDEIVSERRRVPVLDIAIDGF